MAAAARGEGVPIPEGVDYPASGLAFTGIRPGAWIIAPAGCTTNFVFGSSSDYFIGTAGHCANVGDEVTLVAAPGVLMNIGTTVKSVNRGIGNDFALIDVRPSMEQYVNPSMTYFGGPTGAGSPQPNDVVEHAGHGLVIGTGGTPRAGVVVYRGKATAATRSPGSAPPAPGTRVRPFGSPTARPRATSPTSWSAAPTPGDVAGTTIARMLHDRRQAAGAAPDTPDPTF